MGTTVFAFLVLYYAIVLGIGWWAMRRGGAQNLEGYLLGGRRVGPMVTALTLQSTSMSGYMFLGAGSLAHTHGYWALWYAAGDIGGAVVNLSVIGRRMRKLSQITGALTAIEYLEHRYPSPWTRLIAAGLAIFLLASYVVAQFIAGGKGMALITGLPYPLALLIAMTIIIVYTFLGGYLAVAYTDCFQSLVMLVGVLWILAAAVAHFGGFTAGNTAVGAIDPSLLSVWGKDLAFQGQWGVVIGAVLVFSIGYMGWPHVVTRHMAMSRPETTRLASAYATGWNLLFVPAPYLIGILAIALLPQLDDPELAIFSVAHSLLPAAVTGLLMAAIMAAIMSTADSLLLQTGTIASRDLYQRFMRPRATEREMVWVSRALVIAIGGAGYVAAVLEPPTVFTIVIFATSVLGSAFAPAFVCAVWWRGANTPGAIASMLAGAATCVAWELGDLAAATTLHSMLAGLCASTAAMVTVSLATRRIAPVPADVARAVDEAARLGAARPGGLGGAALAMSPEAAEIAAELDLRKESGR